MSVRFQHVVDDQGVTLRLYELRLMRKSGPIPWESWGGRIERRLDRFLRALPGEERASPQDDGLFLPHRTIAELPHALALIVGLPDLARVALALRFDGRFDSPEGRLRLDWMDADHRPVTPRRRGAILMIGDRAGRLTQTLFGLCAGAAPSTRRSEKTLKPALQPGPQFRRRSRLELGGKSRRTPTRRACSSISPGPLPSMSWKVATAQTSLQF